MTKLNQRVERRTPQRSSPHPVGKHPSWAYRLLYSGKIHAITDLGRILIPATELERVLSAAECYNPQSKQKAVIREPAAKKKRAGESAPSKTLTALEGSAR